MRSLLRGGLLPGLLFILAGCGDKPPAAPTPPPRKATPTPKKPTPPVASVAAPAAVTPTPPARKATPTPRQSPRPASATPAPASRAPKPTPAATRQPSPTPQASPPASTTPAVAGDWQVLKAEHYAGLDLTKKIDGGNMPFEEFGFVALDWSEYASDAKGNPLRHEVWIYRMRDPVAAYGIFTYNRDVAAGCRLIAGLGEEAFGYEGGVEFRAGLCYVQVQGELPEETLLNLARGVAGEIKEPGATPALLAALPAEGRVPGSEKYFRGPLAFSSATTLAQDEAVAKLAQGAEGFVARYEPGGGRGELILLRLADEAAAERAAALLQAKEKLPAERVVREGRAVAAWKFAGESVTLAPDLLRRIARAAGGAEVRPVTPRPLPPTPTPPTPPP